MGVLEDSEPPFKRPKLLSPPLTVSPNSSPVVAQVAVHSSSGDPMAGPLNSQADAETVGSGGLIKRFELVRIVTGALYSLGYHKTGALLEHESGIPFNSSAVNKFMQQVMHGEWDQCLLTLRSFALLDETTLASASFLILEHKFLDHLRADNVIAALNTIRNEIVPLRINSDRVRELASCIISPSRMSLFGQDAEAANSKSKIAEKLKGLLTPAVIIPERRLENLLEKVIDVQLDACLFHNSLDNNLSLYLDHHCGFNQIPSQTLQILEAHTDEVWFLQFSHLGKYLASSSKDRSAIIWEVKGDGQLSLKHMLTGHEKPVLTVSWSPDDNQLLTCGQDEALRRWDVNSGECLHVYEKTGVGMVSCGWLPDGKGIFVGMTDRSICLWDLDGRELECWKEKTLRISDMAITDDGKRIISIYGDTTILLVDREVRVERLIEEEEFVTSFSLSLDSKFLLVNLVNQEIHLWSIEGDPKIMSKYKGHTRARFVIRSCLGGFDQSFIASGSEDSQVYIWHRSSGKPLLVLPGHSGAVNSVSWNPTNPHMLASASDDRTIRIWGLNQLKLEHRGQSNGTIHHCNGRS